jgi:hypothetical protein
MEGELFKPDTVEARNEVIWRRLHSDNERIVRALVRAGALSHVKDGKGKTALDYARRRRNLADILSLLTEGHLR